ncbi:MAG: hypothetical protein J6N72_05370 [Psychrobacter sp.]|nr:hypothetical protein [Psychrobacter sp.]
MATINTKLSTEEFIKLYSDNQWVRDFSPVAIEAILTEIEDIQEDECLDWTSSFMGAGEIDYKTLFEENLDKFDIQDLWSEIIDALDGFVEVDDEDTDIIYMTSEDASDRKEYNINDIFKKFTEQLLENSDFTETVFNHVENKAERRMIQLDNGKVLTFS